MSKGYSRNSASKSKTHDFSKVPSASIPRSVFNRSHNHKTSFDSGKLIPVFVDEALPGDTFHLKTQALVRLSTPIVPIMDNMVLDVHYFSVPCRLVWDNWQRFMGEQLNPNETTDFIIPMNKAGATGVEYGSIADYMGIPPKVPNLSFSDLPIRAYNLIYNEWFRDQNLCVREHVDHGDQGNMDYFGGAVKLRAKRHDYFTSCLPWPQKGEGVELPLGVPEMNYVRPFQVGDAVGGHSAVSTSSSNLIVNDPVLADGANLWWHDLGIELTPSSALTINTLRQAFQMQRMLERDARGGSRYVEIIRSHFGVISPDARLQRPEYLGMSSFDVNVNPVVQNSATTDKTPQGNLAAYGVAGGSQNGFSHSFVEHCYIIGIASVRLDQTYQYGLERLWGRSTRYDFYWPSFAHLGEQVVENREIYATGNDDIDLAVFGYQERYAEYRYKPHRVSHIMRSSYATSLDVWHLAEKYSGLPKLNTEFIEQSPNTLNRALAVQNEPQFIGDFFFNLRCVRPMPAYGVPGMIDHF